VYKYSYLLTYLLLLAEAHQAEMVETKPKIGEQIKSMKISRRIREMGV